MTQGAVVRNVMEGDADGSAKRTGFAWTPTPELTRNCTLGRFLAGLDVADLDALVAKADADPGWFWDAVIRHFDLRFAQSYDRILDLSRGLPWPVWCDERST